MNARSRDKRPVERAIRRERRLQRLGSPAPSCVACGLRSVEALLGIPAVVLPPEVRRKLIEHHHPAGRKTESDWTVPVCRNCHALITEDRRGYVLPEPPRTQEERAILHIQAAKEVILLAAPAVAEAQIRVLRAIDQLPPDHPQRLVGILAALLPCALLWPWAGLVAPLILTLCVATVTSGRWPWSQ